MKSGMKYASSFVLARKILQAGSRREKISIYEAKMRMSTGFQ